MQQPILDLDDANAWEWKVGLDGRRVKVLRDNVRGVRVSMHARDSVQAAIAADRSRVTDATGDGGFGLHKPGFRFATDASDAAEQAREAMIAACSEAWRAGPGGHASDLSDGQQQDARRRRKTVERDPQGREVATYEEEVTDGSVADAERIKQQAYDEYVKDAETAWQRLRSA